MSVLSRYVLFELMKVFAFALFAMTLLMMIVGVVAEATKQGLGPAQIVQMLPFLLPEALRFTVPGTILFAACAVFGRMAGANEVVAVKSLGISPMVLLWPVFIFAFLVSLCTVWLNDLAVSWGRNGVRRVVIEAVEEIAYGMLRSQRSYSTSHFSINVMRVDGRRLIRPTLSFQSSGDSPAFTVTAEEAELRSDTKANELTFVCYNSTVDVDGRARVYYPGELMRAVPLSEASERGDNSKMVSWTELRRIPEIIEQRVEELQRFDEERAARAAFQMISGDVSGLVGPEWRTNVAVRQGIVEQIHRGHTEPHRRWAGGFSCLFFVMVGAPLAIRLRNSELMKTFALCFFPILIVYYPLLIFGVDAAKRGDLPPSSVWLGNLILMAWGYWLLRRVIRY